MITSGSEYIYRELIRRVAPLLSREGFKQVGDSFREETADTIHAVDLQRSDDEMKGAVKFTINVGAISKRLLTNSTDEAELEASAAHVYKRIGKLLPISEDYWWVICDGDSPELIFAEIIGVLSLAALPFMRRFETDCDVRAYLDNLREEGEASFSDISNLAQLDARIGTDTEFAGSLLAFERISKESGFSRTEIESQLQNLKLNRREARS